MVQHRDDELLNRNCRYEVTKAEKYKQHQPELSELLEELGNMWEGYLGRITAAKNIMELAPSNVRPGHSATQRADRKRMLLAGTKSYCMLQEDAIVLTTTE